MSTFKKPWATAVALAGACALVLAGCGTEDTAGPETTGPDTPGTTPTDTPTDDVPAYSFESLDCDSGVTSADMLKVGTILPVTGNLSYLGPPEVAGVGLAVDDIVAAGYDACTFFTDSGDSNDMTVSTASAADLINAEVSVVIGAASSSVTLNVIDQLVATPLLMVSPANTAASLSGYSDFYFRTAPPDTVQGAALGSLILSDGAADVAFLVFNDAYGIGLRDVVQATVEEAGGTITYGANGAGQEFPPGQTTFSSEVTAAMASDPDAIVIIAFDETIAVVAELVSQGFDISTTYYTDGNAADYSEDFEPGTMEGAQGTTPGANPADDFKAMVSGWHASVEGSPLSDYIYAAESYDATILAGLASVRGGATDPETLQANMAAVSGSEGGTACSTFAECAELLEGGEEIHYQGISGVGPFNDANDPSSAFIGIYTYDENNTPIWSNAVEGEA